MLGNNCNNISCLYNVVSFDAKGDGLQYDTIAIQNAIDECCTNGGGTVYFPKGIYLTQTIILGDNIEIYLAQGAVILGSKKLSDYRVGEPSPLTPNISWESIIFAKNAQNIRISGNGAIDGQGESFECGAEAYSIDDNDRRKDNKPKIRPSLVYFKGCKNIAFENVKLHNAAHFATLFENCNDLKFNMLSIYNRKNQNTDGLHFFGCNDIFISNCRLDCGDDAIVMNKSAERCAITNCDISSRWSGIRLGPFSTGNICNFTVTNCTIHDTYGSAIKLQMGEGGIMENLTFNNIFARVAENALLESHEVQPFPGELRSCININGIPGNMVENVSFNNMHVVYPGGYLRGSKAGGYTGTGLSIP